MLRRAYTIRIDPNIAQKLDLIAATQGIKPRTFARGILEQAILAQQAIANTENITANQKPA